MKKTILISLVILLFMSALASMIQSFQNEPKGFRDLKWGDPPTEEMKEMKIVEDRNNLFSLKILNNKMFIGNAKFFKIRYNFWVDVDYG